MVATAGLETRRVALQVDLDSQKTGAERNVAGQFATPTELAAGMLRHAKSLANYAGGIRFLDPAVGTGSFYSALLKAFPKGSVGTAVGYEIDRHYGVPAALLWEGSGLEVRLRDFTRARAPEDGKKFNMIICNPPYVRHHHIPKDEKPRLRARALRACGTEIGGLAGLYCYFIGLAHAWMDDGAVAGWLVPSEFMGVNYGAPIRRYLLDRVTLLHIHRFDPADVQFGDALVSSAVVWYSKRDPPRNHAVRFTYGGSLSRPALNRMVPARALREATKWTRYPARDQCGRSGGPILGDFFNIKRGLATGCNGYFSLPPGDGAQGAPRGCVCAHTAKSAVPARDGSAGGRRRKPAGGKAGVPFGLQAGRRRSGATPSRTVELPEGGRGSWHSGAIPLPAQGALVFAGKPATRAVRVYLHWQER